MVLGLLAIGVAVGGLWVWLAPPLHGVVALNHAGERVHEYLGNESESFFVAPVLMLGLLAVVAVLAAGLAWRWRARRGPGMVVALSIGVLGAAATAAGVGVLGVRQRYGALNIAGIPLTADHRVQAVTEAPPVFFGHTPLQVACTLLLPVGVSALVYAVFAAAAAHDDLRGYPTAEAVATADGGVPPGP